MSSPISTGSARHKGNRYADHSATSTEDQLANWGDLVAYIRQAYHVVRDEPDEIRVRLMFGADEDTEGRAQIMVIAHEILDKKEDWVQIATPFARAEEVDLL